MPPRKNKHSEQVVLQLYSSKDDRLVALYIDEILVAYNNIVRVKIPGYDDPLFLNMDNSVILYKGVAYSDFSVSTIGEAREWLAKRNCPISAFDPQETWEGIQDAKQKSKPEED